MTPSNPASGTNGAALHEPHWGDHNDYACRLSGPHCWECNEPWPCRASQGIATERAIGAALDVERLGRAMEEACDALSVNSLCPADAPVLYARLASETPRPGEPELPCSGCGDTRWTKDENWSPAYPESWDGSRTPGNGLVPCGFCNLGGWDVPVGEPTP